MVLYTKKVRKYRKVKKTGKVRKGQRVRNVKKTGKTRKGQKVRKVKKTGKTRRYRGGGSVCVLKPFLIACQTLWIILHVGKIDMNGL